MDDLIAKRTFDLTRDGVPNTLIRVGLGRPYPYDDDSDTWACNVCIERPERPITRTVYGIVSLQALMLAAYALQIEMESLQAEYRHYGHRLTFLDQDDLFVRNEG